MSINIRKIAKDLQLAVSTVSKALNDSYEISAETKKRVFDYAKKLDYVPNPYASSLKQRKTRTIAVVLPEVADSFFSSSINGIESVAQTKGYHVMVYITHEDLEKEIAIIRDLRSGRVDGVLISVSSGVEKNSDMHNLCAKKIPLVFFDRACEGIVAAKVLTDDYDSGYKATTHLLAKKCQKVVFLAPMEDLSIIQDRIDGYKKAMRDNGRKVKNEWIVQCTNNEEETYSTIRELLRRKDRPDGIIGSIEKHATLTYTVCNDLKIKIPQDIKVVGFSSLPIASLLSPSLTTITQPAFEMGRMAATLLFDSLEKKKADVQHQRVIIPSTLMERNSTKLT